MKPYYQEDGITIYQGDCLSCLLDGVVKPGLSCVIVDPPYASGARTEAAKSSSGAMLRGVRWAAKPMTNDQMTSTGFVWFMRQLCLASYPLLVEGGSLLSFIDWRQWPNLAGAVESTNFRLNQMVVWDKNSYGLGHGFRSQHELILHASKGVPSIASNGAGNVFVTPRDRTSDHPSPKPVTLLEKLLRVVSHENEIVLDPCCGTGSTLEAAKNLHRQAIGIEIEERYCEIAAKRLSQKVLNFGAPRDARHAPQAGGPNDHAD